MSSEIASYLPLSIPHLQGNEARYLDECLQTNYVSSVGPFVGRFEQQLCDRTQFNHAVAMASGTAALHIALLAAGVQPDDLVIIPSYTFIATANAVSYCGAKPWIVDISELDWNLDFEALHVLLETNTEFDAKGVLRHCETRQRVSAVVPVFSMGMPIDFTQANQLCETFTLKLVVDAAAGIGATYHDLQLGLLPCDALTFSFNGNKNITAGGGGCVLTNQERLAQTARHLSTTGKIDNQYNHDCVAFNYRMTNLHAAVGCAQLEQLDAILAKKEAIDWYYRSHIKATEIEFFPLLTDRTSARWLSGIRLTHQAIEHFIQALTAQRVEAKLFWKPIHLQPPYQNQLTGSVPLADKLWRKILVLPSSCHLTEADLERVCTITNQLLEELQRHAID